MEGVELLDGPFDRSAHTVDLRRLGSARSPGRHGVDAVGLWVWRTHTWPLVSSQAACLEEISPSCFTFSVLGNDTPIWRRPEPEEAATTIATEANLPVPLRRRSLAADPAAVYGPDRSFDLQVGVRRSGKVSREHVPVERLVAADLGDWQYRPRRGTVAVDPERGRVAFPPGQAPQGLWVSYRYGTSADIGGGTYPRRLVRPAAGTFHQTVSQTRPHPKGSVRSIAAALSRWERVRAKQPTCVIEVLDSEVYTERLVVSVHRGEQVEIRAADRTRPVIHLLDRRRNAPDALVILAETPDDETADDETADQGPPDDQRGGCVRLDGLLVTGRAVHVEGPLQRLEIVDCTLVPGWGLEGDCQPTRPAEPSLELSSVRGPVVIERSILGSIQVYADEVTSDPVEIRLCDSVVDATSDEREAVGAPNWPLAHAALTLRDCTVIGQVQTHAVLLAENTIFTGRVRVARRQLGCIRYSYVPPRSRTPRRHRCQPDLVEAAARSVAVVEGDTAEELTARLALARERVVPVFDSTRYGQPAYVRLAPTGAVEIDRGADDESEMGALHYLYQPQRRANLITRLEQFTPARSDSGVLLADQESPVRAHRTSY